MIFRLSFLSVFLTFTSASLLDYFFPKRTTTDLETFPTVPFELNENDEQFLMEAAKLAGINLSELDLCHHRIVLKLRKSCSELNAEQIGKLSVALLNCQSGAEGRTIFECTENMTLRECTSDMDKLTWNAYHLITNRAKAVCSSIRQEQFRGLTEMTVNKLMNSAHEQIEMMNQLRDDSKQLQEITDLARREMEEKNGLLLSQQNDILKISETHRAKIETNLRELSRERSLIRTGQMEMTNLLSKMKANIDESLKQLESQATRSKLQYNAIMEDLHNGQNSLAEQQHLSAEYYDHTIEQLKRMNSTIYDLVSLIEQLQREFDSKLSWVADKVGGTDDLTRRINTTIVHLAYLLMGMLSLVFVNADQFTRIFFILAVPANFLATILNWHSLDVLTLSGTLIAIISGHYIWKFTDKDRIKSWFAMSNENQAPLPLEEIPPAEVNREFINNFRPKKRDVNREKSLTPLTRRFLSRNLDDSRRSATPFSVSLGEDRSQCSAITLKGDTCKNASLIGEEFCRIHLKRH